MKGLTLNQKEQSRLETLNRVLQKELCVKDAAFLLGVTERHAWRLLAAYREEGAGGLSHKGRGRTPHHAVPKETRDRVIRLARTVYAGVNHTHLTELLAEREGLLLSRSTVRRILITAGIPSTRLRRKRFPMEGMLLQMDGSDHDWLEGRGPQLVLLFAVDDATGKVPWGLFHPEENSLGYFLLLQGIVERCGIPLSLYTDRHSVFRPVRRSRGGKRPLPIAKREVTQFGRAMSELGIFHAVASSPEGKGRVERMANTLQDRLVSELRMAGASTLEEANRVLWAYVPRFNERFAVPAAQSRIAYRAVPSDMQLKENLCFKQRRKVAMDNTVKYNWRTLQLLPDRDRRSHAGSHVEVREHLDDSLTVAFQGHTIPTQEAPHRRSVLRETTANIGTTTNWDELAKYLMRVLPEPHEFAAVPADCDWAPTPRMVAYWEAIQDAKRRGLSGRAIARELGISRNTVRKYSMASQPPVHHGRRLRPTQQEVLTSSMNS